MESNASAEFLICKEANLPNGETLYYREVGSGSQVLILLHGTMASSFAFSQAAPMLAANMRVIALDMRGFGFSSYNKPIATHAELSDDIKLLVDKLKISKCSVLGWSTGGMVAFYFAVKYPETIEKLILLSCVGPQGLPFYKSDADGQDTKERITTVEDLKYNFLSANVAKATSAGDKTLLREVYDIVFFKTNKPEENNYNMRLDEVLKQRNSLEIDKANLTVNVTEEESGISKGDGSIKTLKCQTLVLHGELDPIVSVDDAKKWNSLLGDLGTTQIFSDSKHNLFELHLKDVVESVNKFILM